MLLFPVTKAIAGKHLIHMIESIPRQKPGLTNTTHRTLLQHRVVSHKPLIDEGRVIHGRRSWPTINNARRPLRLP
jgi:hypothetical protein